MVLQRNTENKIIEFRQCTVINMNDHDRSLSSLNVKWERLTVCIFFGKTRPVTWKQGTPMLCESRFGGKTQHCYTAGFFFQSNNMEEILCPMFLISVILKHILK